MEWVTVLVIAGFVGGLVYLVELVGRLLLLAFRALQDLRTPAAFRNAHAPQ